MEESYSFKNNPIQKKKNHLGSNRWQLFVIFLGIYLFIYLLIAALRQKIQKKHFVYNWYLFEQDTLFYVIISLKNNMSKINNNTNRLGLSEIWSFIFNLGKVIRLPFFEEIQNSKHSAPFFLTIPWHGYMFKFYK